MVAIVIRSDQRHSPVDLHCRSKLDISKALLNFMTLNSIISYRYVPSTAVNLRTVSYVQ